MSLPARTLHLFTRFPRLAALGRRSHVAIFRLSRGRFMAQWFGSPVLVLETVGRKSNKRRRATMTYCRVDEGYAVIPINAGSERTPGWWLNLRATGTATLTVRGARVSVRAHELTGEDADRVWRRYAQQTPMIEEFRGYAQRQIPLVLLSPINP